VLIERTLRVISLTASLLVIAGFILFAVDQAGEASKSSRDKIAGVREADPAPEVRAQRAREHGAVREAIDRANDFLLKPFKPIVTTKAPWPNRGLLALLALAVYGFGLGYLASFGRGRFR
jgi:hypothetical protein